MTEASPRAEQLDETPAPTAAPQLAIDETFDFVEFDEKSAPRLSRWFWVQWCVLLGVGFGMLSVLEGGFDNVREYGWTEAGVNKILLFSHTETIFGLALLALLPLAIFLVLGLEDVLWRPFARLAAWLRPASRRRAALLVLVLAAGGAIVAGSQWMLAKRPVTDDENVYLFQTRILAKGWLTLPSLPDQEPLHDRLFEDNIFLVNNGKIFGQYPFGQSLMLLPGYLLGWAHLTPLLFALAAIFGMYALVGRLYGPNWGLVGAALLAVSPTFLATSATLLSHTSTLCFLVWFLYFAHRTWKDPAWWTAIPAGLFFLLAFQVRSATTLLAAGPVGLALAVALLRDAKRQWRKIAWLAAFVILAIGISLWLNQHVNGDPFKTNYHAAWGEGRTPFKHPFGFEKGAWHLIHTPAQGLWNALDNLLRLNWWMLGWPISLIFVLAWLLRRDKLAEEWAAFAGVGMTFFAYYFYFWPGVADTGPVLYYELIAVLIPLTISGLIAAPRLLLPWMPRPLAARRTALFVVFSTLIAFATFHQFEVRGLNHVAGRVGQLDDVLERFDVPANAVVFTNYYLKIAGEKNFQDSWVVGRPFTSRLLDDPRLFYINYGRTRDDEFLAKYHPGRPAYVVVWTDAGSPSVMKLSDYQVAAMPDNLPDSR
jgi:hypothetical protein